MRFLGLDLGTKTLGVAVSDKTGLIANTLKTINFKDENYSNLLKPLKEIINEYEVKKIVLGFPKNMNNSIGLRAEITIKFKKLLEENFTIEVILQDERLSSKSAESILIEADMSRKKRKKIIDKMAAIQILTTYMQRNKNRNSGI